MNGFNYRIVVDRSYKADDIYVLGGRIELKMELYVPLSGKFISWYMPIYEYNYHHDKPVARDYTTANLIVQEKLNKIVEILED